MFGYILPEKPELKMKEYELFRAYYCGVCKSIGKRHGQISRVTLNYDSTFLALLLSSLVEERVDVKRERCIVHPLQKRAIVKNNLLIDYAADMNIILAYYKLEDDWKDERSKKSFAVMQVLKPAFRKIRVNHKEKCGIIEARLEELSALEKQKCSSIDEAAEPFAKIMEEIMAYGEVCEEPKIEKILRWMGYNIGRWIYILDAYDDIEKDIREKTYNPFLYQYRYFERAGELEIIASGCDSDDCGSSCKGSGNQQDAKIEGFKSEIVESVDFSLTYTLNQISKGYELLATMGCSSIVENIVYMGMLRKTEQILKKGSCKGNEKSI
jgi:hypothetical protein